jgi:hypothetical protein
MMKPTTTIETHPLYGEDAGPIPIVSPSSEQEELATIIDPEKDPKQIDPSTSRESPIHERLRNQNAGKQKGWLQACLSIHRNETYLSYAS